ncbi:MAG TPA: hypothetical protein VK660_05405, partial [Xanthomonadaceae bacterium]|nr:hypothetical protein [Xanthomonadaceae bacterium]
MPIIAERTPARDAMRSFDYHALRAVFPLPMPSMAALHILEDFQMNKLQRLLMASALAAITFTAGCNHPTGQASHESRPPRVDAAQIARADAQISQTAWLHDHLPEHTVAYARIPSLWGVASAPDGRPLDAVLASEQHAKMIATLRKAAQTDPTIAQTKAGPVLQLLVGDQAAPIELAVIDASDGISPFSRALVTTVLDVPDVAALNARIAALSAGSQSPLQAPLDANGDASLQRFGALHFDAQTHRLYLSLGTTASALTLQQDMAQLTSSHAHPMQDAEREIDQSGQGLFAWMSMKGLNNQLEAQLQDQPPDGLLRDAVEHAQSVALGWGTVDGHGRLQLQVRAPQARLLGYLAPNAGEIDLKSAGRPNWVLTVAEPGTDNVHAIHDNLDRDFGAGLRARADTALAQVETKTGVDLIALQGLFGAHALMFSDANGLFKAIRVRDRKALYAKIDDLGKRFGWQNNVVSVGGAEIHHLRIPAHDPSNDATSLDADARAATRLAARFSTTNLYWIEDGDYLVLADVPQLLMDRVASKPDVSIGAWLHDSQSYDNAHTVVGYTGTTHDLQREVYYAYLNFLEVAGEVLGQPVDLATLPNAGQLKLPTDGVAGFALEANDQRL